MNSSLKVPTCIFHGRMDIQACRLLQVAMADASFSAAKLGQEPKDEGHRETDRELVDRGWVWEHINNTWKLIQGSKMNKILNCLSCTEVLKPQSYL